MGWFRPPQCGGHGSVGVIWMLVMPALIAAAAEVSGTSSSFLTFTLTFSSPFVSYLIFLSHSDYHCRAYDWLKR